MIMNMNEKGRQTKLLAAIAVLVMVVCALAVVMPSDNVDAVSTENIPATAPFGEENGIFEYDDGVYTVSSDYTVDVAATGMSLGTSSSPLDIRFEIAEGATLTFINSGTTAKTVYISNIYSGTGNGSAPEKSVFYGGSGTYGEIGAEGYGTLAVDGNVELALNMDVTNDGTAAHNHVLYDVNVALTNGATLTVSQTSGNQSYFCSNLEDFCQLNVSGGSEIVFDAANGMSGVNGIISDDSVFTVENPKTGTVWMNFANLEIDETSTVEVVASAATNTGIYITQTLQNNGTIDTPNSSLGAADGSEIINKGTMEASAIAGGTSKTANIYNYGTFDVTTTTGYNVKDGAVATSSAQVTTMLADEDIDVVMVEAAVQITGVSVPAGKELVISGDATIGTITINGAGAVVTLNGAATQNGTVNSVENNVTDGTIEFGNATGYFQITYGSCDFVMDLMTGSVELGGTYDATSNTFGTNGTVTGTIAEGTTVTVTGDYNVTGGLTVDGTLVVDGGRLNAVSNNIITVNGTLTVTGDNGRVRCAQALVLGEDTIVNGITLGAIGTSYTGNIYSTVEFAISCEKKEATYVINGDCGDVITIISGYKSSVAVAPGSSFVGDIVYQYVTGTQGQNGYEEHTNTVTVSYENVTNAIVTIASVEVNSEVLTVSNATVTGMEGCVDDDETNDIVLNNVTLDSFILNDIVSMTGDSNQIPNGQIVTFDVNGQIVLGNGADLYVYGDIAKTAATTDVKGKIDNSQGVVYYTTQNYRNLAAIVESDDEDYFKPMASHNVGSIDDLLEYNYPGSSIVLTADLYVYGNVELTGVTIYTNGFDIIVGERSAGVAAAGTLVLTDSTIDRDNVPAGVTNSNTDDEKIVVMSGSSMEVVDSLLFIEVDAREGSSIDVDNADVTYDNTTSEVRVGYGTVLNFSGTAVSSIDVYGELVISSNVSLPATNEFNVWSGAKVTINSTVTSLGDVHFYSGSDVTIAEGASFTLGDRNGGADMTVDGNVTVATGATFTVTGVSTTAVASNTLTVTSAGDYAFTVEGTMTVGGTLTGTIQDKGTITFNGRSVDGEIVIYDGVTLTVTSVSGALTVSDYGIVETVGETSDASYGNEVVLTDVRGVTVTETVTTVSYTSNGQNHRDYVATMDVSGTISTGAVVGIITVDKSTAEDAIDLVGEDKDQYATVTVSGELVLGKDVVLTVNGGELVVSGTVTGTTANSENFLNSHDKVSVANGATITVTGTVTIADEEIMGSGTVNAVWYVVTGTDAETYTYTNFGNAVTAAPNADEDTITVVGEVEVTANVDVPAGIIVEIVDGDMLVIAEDVTVTIADGATVNGTRATIDVNGTLVSNDYDEDMNVKTIIADVVTTDGAVRTWTSLANALANAQPGQTITANGAITITEDTVIPEGVTVYTEYTFTVDDAALTINGTLQLDDKANSGDNDGLVITAAEDSEIIVGGVLSVETLAANASGVEIGDDLAGAHFAVNNGAFRTYYVSNVEFAAETVSNNANVEDGVTIKGIVTAGDVTFTAPENLGLVITVEQLADTDEGATILTMGTMTLAGNTDLVIADANTRVTGSVVALCGDGTATAIIDLRNVYGPFMVSADLAEVTEGYEYTVTLAGNYDGAVTVSAGTVETDKVVVDNGATLTVGSGAELIVPADMSITAGITERVTESVVIDGTLTVQDADALSGEGFVVNGTMATDGVGLNIGNALELRVNGTMTIDANEVLTIGGTLYLGDKPTAIGSTTTASVTGTVEFAPSANGLIVAYAGADLSGADIQLNPATGESEAESTAYYLDDALYATLYTVSTTIQIEDIYGVDGGFDLNGIGVYGTWYETAEEAITQSQALINVGVADPGVESEYIGDYEAVYGAYMNIGVPGMISVGNGMTLYIDGLTINNYLVVENTYALSVGTHVISIQANAGYSIENATITFNGQTVQNGGTITIDADAVSFSIVTSGATIADQTVVVEGGSGSGEMGLTDYLLIILVILIVVMAIMVALRLMRS